MKHPVLITKNKTNVTTNHNVLIFNLFVNTLFFACSCNRLENLDITLILSPVMDNEPKHVRL